MHSFSLSNTLPHSVTHPHVHSLPPAIGADAVLGRLRQPRIESVVPTTKGFMLIGGNGFVAIYERIDDKREPYIETKRLSLGNLQLCYAAVFPSEDRMVVISATSRLLMIHLDASNLSIGSRASQAVSGTNRKSSQDLTGRSGGKMLGEEESMRPRGDLSTATDLPFEGHHLQQVSGFSESEREYERVQW